MRRSGLSQICWITVLMTGSLWSSTLTERLESRHEALLEERREELPRLSDPFGVPDRAVRVIERPRWNRLPVAAWRGNVVATVFWVGEEPAGNNPTPNHASAWDPNWMENFGGYDHPVRRQGHGPEGFVPRQNPFYVALPYNDIGPDGLHRPEASKVIPWFWEAFQGEGISVCKGRWIAIHEGGRVCYAQWEDVGPFETDHWQYVFGGAEPKENRNGGAGIDISPAVRDFLELRSGDRVQWRFVEERDVPPGPWRDWLSR